MLGVAWCRRGAGLRSTRLCGCQTQDETGTDEER
jgi:hypothetical protein